MNHLDLLSKMNLDLSTEENEYSQLLKKIDFDIDSSYLSFIKKYNGAYGFVNNVYLHLWVIKDLISLNPYYEITVDDGYSVGVFFIGSNGGDIGYGIRKDDRMYIEIPFLDIGTDVPEKECGRDFDEFITYLNQISS